MSSALLPLPSSVEADNSSSETMLSGSLQLSDEVEQAEAGCRRRFRFRAGSGLESLSLPLFVRIGSAGGAAASLAADGAVATGFCFAAAVPGGRPRFRFGRVVGVETLALAADTLDGATAAPFAPLAGYT